MTGTPAVPRQLDAAAAHARDLFGHVFLLTGLAVADRPKRQFADDHPMAPAWDTRGRLVYQCDPACKLHTVLASLADAWAWHAYAIVSRTPPHAVSCPYQRRALLVAHVSHVCLTAGVTTDPVTSLGWASYPNPTLT